VQSILSVGIDIGTTTTHLIVSKLGFANDSILNQSPRLRVAEKQIVYEGEIRFTPLTEDGCIDSKRIAQLISKEYLAAGIEPASVQSGAVIITGESAKLRNAEAVARELSSFAGDFVVASAGPNLESILAARGSGAFERSREQGTTILNMDIGGGTVNVAVISCGELIDSACLSVGGRALRISSQGLIESITESGERLFNGNGKRVQSGMTIDCEELFSLADMEAECIMSFISGAHHALVSTTDRLRCDYRIDEMCLTGGVSELINNKATGKGTRSSSSLEDLVPFNDLGLCLATSLQRRLQVGELPYRIPQSPIRATVIGAGMHSLQVTGSTIDVSTVVLPLKNVPMVHLDPGKDLVRQPDRFFDDVQNQLRHNDIDWTATPIALFIKELPELSYEYLKQLSIDLAEALQRARACQPYIIAVEDDVAAALGLLLRQRLRDANILVIDGVESSDGDYIDLGRPIVHSQQGETSIALPVVIKSLVFK